MRPGDSSVVVVADSVVVCGGGWALLNDLDEALFLTLWRNDRLVGILQVTLWDLEILLQLLFLLRVELLVRAGVVSMDCKCWDHAHSSVVKDRVRYVAGPCHFKHPEQNGSLIRILILSTTALLSLFIVTDDCWLSLFVQERCWAGSQPRRSPFSPLQLEYPFFGGLTFLILGIARFWLLGGCPFP